MNSTHEFTLKEGPKVKMENFLGTKSEDGKFFRDQKLKKIFRGTKTKS